MKRGQEAIKKIDGSNHVAAGERQQELAKIAKAVEVIEETGKKTKAKTVHEQRVRTAAKEDEVRKAQNEVRSALKASGHLQEFTTLGSSGKKGKTKTRKAKGNGQQSQSGARSLHNVTVEEFQAAVGRIIPRLKRAGLNQDQIDEVLDIIADLVTS